MIARTTQRVLSPLQLPRSSQYQLVKDVCGIPQPVPTDPNERRALQKHTIKRKRGQWSTTETSDNETKTLEGGVEGDEEGAYTRTWGLNDLNLVLYFITILNTLCRGMVP